MNAIKRYALSAGLILYFATNVVHAAVTAGATQFTSKLYTEGLGRLPDQPGWNLALSFWQNNSCGAQSLATAAEGILTSSEFLANSPTNHERVFRLYRAALHRDGSASELTNVINQLNNGATWASIVSSFLSSTEFINKVSANCSNNSSGWGPSPPDNLVVSNTGSATSEPQLRNALLNAAPGSTVFLEQGATILLTQTLTIPQGVTLATYGFPGKAKSPLLARLARNSLFQGPLVEMRDNSTLKSVWVDGQRNRFGFLPGDQYPVTMPVYAIGSNIAVENNIISDSPTWTSIQFLKKNPCDNGQVIGNLITAYGSNHWDKTWTDGISIACRNVKVEGNEIVDATDVGIIVFTVYPEVQSSQVLNNYILNAGNPAYGGIVADPLSIHNFSNVPQSTIHDFTGTNFSGNIIWSSPAVHLDFVISSGTRPWFGPDAYTGKGATFFNNGSGTEQVSAFVGIGVSGMIDTSVQGNGFYVLGMFSATYPSCGVHGVVVAPPPYGDSADVQSHTVLSSTDKIVTGCISHAPYSPL